MFKDTDHRSKFVVMGGERCCQSERCATLCEGFLGQLCSDSTVAGRERWKKIVLCLLHGKVRWNSARHLTFLWHGANQLPQPAEWGARWEWLHTHAHAHAHARTHPHTRTHTHTYTRNRFMALFPGPTRWTGARRNKLLLDVMVQGKITEADIPTIQLGATPSKLISDPPPSSPHFYAGCPSCHNPPTLSWLGSRTKQAGLHAQWFHRHIISSTIHMLLCTAVKIILKHSSPDVGKLSDLSKNLILQNACQ